MEFLLRLLFCVGFGDFLSGRVGEDAGDFRCSCSVRKVLSLKLCRILFGILVSLGVSRLHRQEAGV